MGISDEALRSAQEVGRVALEEFIAFNLAQENKNPHMQDNDKKPDGIMKYRGKLPAGTES
ncbi:hypothetical protein KX75_20115 [Salmonella enterica subsp. enterica]|nr:hypothetical protein [Salmonella enterica subsp. enterica serovar Mikawasima]EDN7229180.1 hypothetical protein [Salmonella enterica subsp. enterica serovar Mikawasima]